MSLAEIIASICIPLATLAMGRIWYLTSQRDKKMVEGINELNIAIRANQSIITEHSKSIAITLEKIESLEMLSMQRMDYIEKEVGNISRRRR